MDIFEFRDRLIESYKSFSRSFTKIESEDIREKVNEELKAYWPEPLIQINPLSVKITFATLSVLHGVVKHAIFAGVYR